MIDVDETSDDVDSKQMDNVKGQTPYQYYTNLILRQQK